MVTLLFDFNQEKAEQCGYNLEEVASRIRTYLKKNGACETKNLFFELEGEDAMCIAASLVIDIVKMDPGFVNIMNEWVLNVDGDKEDCIEFAKEKNAQKGIA
ncbi:MAG: hypothetical protein HFJ09_09450 [Lachnospiraceae bacterium]|nr:hypothetical protein [Lachnospiraceae bacterium]